MIPPKIEAQKDRFLLSFEHIHTWVGCQESLQHLGGRGRGCREGGGKLRHRRDDQEHLRNMEEET